LELTDATGFFTAFLESDPECLETLNLIQNFVIANTDENHEDIIDASDFF
jgi:hypothetical protein